MKNIVIADFRVTTGATTASTVPDEETDESGDNDYDVQCQVDEYQCNDGLCVELSALCDRFPDCLGGEDEENCLG